MRSSSDHGIPDNSQKFAVDLTQENSHLIVVKISRQFGRHKEILTGLAQLRERLSFWSPAILKRNLSGCLNLMGGCSKSAVTLCMMSQLIKRTDGSSAGALSGFIASLGHSLGLSFCKILSP